MSKKNKKVIKKKKTKIKKKAILIFLIFSIMISLITYYIYQIRITNIYIIDNENISDLEVIKLAKLENYPNSLKNSCSIIKKRLEKSKYIKSADVKKKGFFNEVYIYIEENKPLFYYQIKNKVILKDGEEVEDNYNIPIVTNEIDKELYQEFLEKMALIDNNILLRISEIKYDPNDIDKMRFYLTMNDGNYVYLTLRKFERINNYLEIVKTFDNAKGILYLDSGEYFEIFKEKGE